MKKCLECVDGAPGAAGGVQRWFAWRLLFSQGIRHGAGECVAVIFRGTGVSGTARLWFSVAAAQSRLPAVLWARPGDQPTLCCRAQGGDWCYSESSCETRWSVSPQYMSATGWGGISSFGGIFDENTEKSPWGNVNKFYIGYCSSDAWIGVRAVYVLCPLSPFISSLSKLHEASSSHTQDLPASSATFGWAFRGQRILTATLQAMVGAAPPP